jgi:uncharacterized protein
LRAAIRARANFAEYVPIIILMVGALELLGTPAIQLHMLLGTLLVSRVIHPFGLQVKAGTTQFLVGRVFGITLTIFVLVTSALLLLRAQVVMIRLAGGFGEALSYLMTCMMVTTGGG